MFISIFACTQLTMSDATIADVGNSMIPRLSACAVRGTLTEHYPDLVEDFGESCALYLFTGNCFL